MFKPPASLNFGRYMDYRQGETKMIRSVYFYKYFGDPTPITEDDFLVVTLCKPCAKKWGKNGEVISEIDKAGDWDICQECEAQNVPAYYKPGMMTGMDNQFNPSA